MLIDKAACSFLLGVCCLGFRLSNQFAQPIYRLARFALDQINAKYLRGFRLRFASLIE